MPTSKYSNVEVSHWLSFIRSDEWWQSQMPVSMRALGAVVGIRHTYLEKHLQVIGKIIDDIESRKLCFLSGRRGRIKRCEVRAPAFIWMTPPEDPPKIPQLCAEGLWSLWAACRSCRKNKFLPVVIDDKPHAACYHCIPPDQYASIGAQAVNRSLIQEALTPFY